MKVSHRRME